MPDCRLGAHTFIFQQYGFDHVKQIDRILTIVKESGFDAVELHQKAIEGDDARSRVEAALIRSGQHLVGASNGQPLWNHAEYERILDAMDQFGDNLSELGEGLKCGMSCSGKRMADRSEAANKHLIQVWNEVAEGFRSKDLVLLYHTHGESAEDIALVLENVEPDVLPLNPDLDWLRVGGIDPDAFIKEHAERIQMIHLRDYHTGGDRTSALGEGDVDYEKLGKLLDDVGFTGDIVVELALPSGTPPERPIAELLQTSREHIRERMGI